MVKMEWQYSIMKMYYKDYNVMYRLIRSLHNREFALLVPSWRDKLEFKRNTRSLKGHNFQSLKFLFDYYKITRGQRIYNLYYSLAKYKDGIPKFTLTGRDTQDWTINHWKEIEKFDFVLDIDAGDYEDMKFAVISMQEIHTFLDLCRCPHEIIFSGNGFHILIDGKEFNFLNKNYDPYDNKNNIYSFHRELALKFFNKFSEMIDMKIYDSRRVLKIRYSLAIYKDSVQMCRPLLTNEDIYSFDYNPYNKFVEPSKQSGRFIFNDGLDNNIKDMLIKLKVV